MSTQLPAVFGLLLPALIISCGDTPSAEAGKVQSDEEPTSVADAPAIRWPVTFYIEKHPEFGSVGTSMSIDVAEAPGTASIALRDEGVPDLKLAFEVGGPGGDEVGDLYALTCDVLADGAISTIQREVVFAGEPIEVWRDDVWSMGLRSPE